MALIHHDFRQLSAGDADIAAALDVLRAGFAAMDGRIDPPSSLIGMTAEDLSHIATNAEVWVVGSPVAGTVTLTVKGPVLHVGKLAVRPGVKRTGLGRALMTLAEDRAAALGLEWLELQSRVELVEVHAVFKRLGFREVARLSHAGYPRPTSVLFRKETG